MGDSLDERAKLLENKDDAICGDPHDLFYLASDLHSALKAAQEENDHLTEMNRQMGLLVYDTEQDLTG